MSNRAKWVITRTASEIIESATKRLATLNALIETTTDLKAAMVRLHGYGSKEAKAAAQADLEPVVETAKMLAFFRLAHPEREYELDLEDLNTLGFYDNDQDFDEKITTLREIADGKRSVLTGELFEVAEAAA